VRTEPEIGKPSDEVFSEHELNDEGNPHSLLRGRLQSGLVFGRQVFEGFWKVDQVEGDEMRSVICQKHMVSMMASWNCNKGLPVVSAGVRAEESVKI